MAREYKQQIEHAARALLLDKQICAVASQRMTLKGALLKVGFSQEKSTIISINMPWIGPKGAQEKI